MKFHQSLALGLAIAAPVAQAQVLIEENFNDSRVGDRGWYNLENVYVSTDTYRSAPASLEFRFGKGALVPDTKVLRQKFADTEQVYLSYWVKYSDNWVGSKKDHHPHQFYLLTNQDDAYAGPAETNLTVYAEAVGGRMKFGMQDTLNVDQNRINKNLVGQTENRAVSGCNGNADSGKTSCYRNGSIYRNVKSWNAPEVTFTDQKGPSYKGDWHKVEALVKLNSIVDGKGVADGVLRMWVDGKPIIDRTDALMRTAKHPNMKFNQVMIGPYIGGGSPIEQTFWVDDVIIATERPGGAAPAPAAAAPVPVPTHAPALPAQVTGPSPVPPVQLPGLSPVPSLRIPGLDPTTTPVNIPGLGFTQPAQVPVYGAPAVNPAPQPQVAAPANHPAVRAHTLGPLGP